MAIKELIERIEVGTGGASSITFSSIPQTFTDLVLVLSGRTNRSTVYSDILIKLNSSTANFTHRQLYGTGSSTASWTASAGYLGAISANTSTANTHGSMSIYIPNYAGATAKSISADSVSENNATAAQAAIGAILWNSTTAITSVELYPDASASFQEFSSASLYGITAGTDGITTVS